MLSAIIALGPNNLIGTKENSLPWSDKEFKFLRSIDMLIFKEFTFGKDIVMGRKTWDSLNRTKLKNRGIHYIISSKKRQSLDPQVIYLTLDEFKNILKNTASEIVCIGGKQLFESLVLYFDTLVINKIETEALKSFNNGIYLKDYNFTSEPFNFKIIDNTSVYIEKKTNDIDLNPIHLVSLKMVKKTQSK